MATYVEGGSRRLAVGEAASLLNVHPNTGRRWAQAGLLALAEREMERPWNPKTT